MLVQFKGSQRRRPLLLAAAFGIGCAVYAVCQPASAISEGIAGVWVDHTGRGAVEIAPCGGHYCGHIAWLEPGVLQRGAPLLDRNNPDPKHRQMPMCGARILDNLAEDRKSGGRVWSGGSIYDPERGESFDVELTLLGPDRLQVLGYAGLKIFGETYVWKRAPADLARCGPPHD